VKSRLVIDCDLLTWSNVAERNEENVTVAYLHKCIRLARMIYVMRTVTTATTVEAPAIIDGADSQSSARRSPVGLSI
jgi:hypothetical protein